MSAKINNFEYQIKGVKGDVYKIAIYCRNHFVRNIERRLRKDKETGYTYFNIDGDERVYLNEFRPLRRQSA